MSARTRNWTFIVYPESAPDNWRSLLDALHVEWVESPLHDKDVNEADEEQKKSHWHILLMFDGMKSYEQVREVTLSLKGTIPIPCASAKGLVRYMAHLDNPEKYQYSKELIIGHGGADVAELLKPSSGFRYKMISDMMEWCQLSNINEFEDLCSYARTEHSGDWFPLLCDNSAVIMGMFLKSRNFKHQAKQKEEKERKEDEKRVKEKDSGHFAK